MVIKRKSVWLDKDFKVGEVERTEEAESDLFDHWPVAAPDGETWMIGKSTTGWYLFDPAGETGWEALRGWTGYAQQETLLRDLGRHLTADLVPVPPNLPSMPDKHFPDCVLVKASAVPYHQRFPIMVDTDVTYYRMNRAGEVVCMVSIDTEDVHLAWDRCGDCSMSLYGCKCRAGVKQPRSIAWCLERSSSGWADLASYKRTYVPTTGSNDLPTRGTPAVTPTKPAAARKMPAPAPVAVMDKPTAEDSAAMAELDSGSFDLSNLQSAAEEAAAKSTRKVIRRRKPGAK